MIWQLLDNGITKWLKIKDLKYQEYVTSPKGENVRSYTVERNGFLQYTRTPLNFKILFKIILICCRSMSEEAVYCQTAPDTGEEALALRLLGFSNCYGTDLIPHAEHVIEDDIHDMQFEENTVGLFYSNIFDHSLYPKKFLNEIVRCLRPGGHAFLQLQLGRELDHYGVLEIEGPQDFHELLDDADLTNRIKVVVSEKNTVLTPHNHSLNWNVIFQKI